MLTSLERDFFAFAFLTFFPNASDLKAVKAASFSFDRDRFTSSIPSEMSLANALRTLISFSYKGVFIVPSFSRICLVLGLFIIVLMIAAFLEGVAGRVAFTLSVLRFFAVLFAYPRYSFSNVVSFLLCSCFLSRYFRTLSLVCFLIFSFLAWTLARASSLTCFACFFRAISLTVRLVRSVDSR